MSWLNTIKGLTWAGTKTWASAFNWQLFLAKAAIVALLFGGTYALGVYNTKVGYAEAEAARAKANAVVIHDVVVKRIPVIQEQEQKAAEVQYVVKTIKEKLNEELAKNPDRPACVITDAELQYYREIAKQTRVY